MSGASEVSELAQRVRELRRARGWSQAELAQRTGLALSSIQKLEQGIRGDPLWVSVLTLARTFGVSILTFESGSATPWQKVARLARELAAAVEEAEKALPTTPGSEQPNSRS